MLKRPFIYLIQIFPPARRYLEEKINMTSELVLQEAKIKGLRELNGQYAYEIKSLKGTVPNSIPIQIPVTERDIEASLLTNEYENLPKYFKKNLLINWVIPPMGSVSGGHTDIFRTINYLERQGHVCKVYFYDPLGHQDLGSLLTLLKNNYPEVQSQIFYNELRIEDCDALFATSWETAYPVYNFQGVGKKYYYVQDYEPFFKPHSTDYLLAERTYTFGLHGLTLGEWLSKKLQIEYKMLCEHFDFGVNTSEYYVDNNKKKNKNIFCYVRPVTPRRGFELAIPALKIFHDKFPDYKIHLVGWDVSQYKIPFPYINHKVLSHTKLNDIYNICSAGLVLSLTNMSLIPLEMLAAGCIPVVNEGPNTRDVKYRKWVQYSQPYPPALAEALEKVITMKNLKAFSKKAANDVKKFSWEVSNARIETIILEQAKNGASI